MPTALENRIAAQARKIDVLDDRIGRLMSRRVYEEDRLADLYTKRNAEALPPSLNGKVLHHINGDECDNRLENLRVMDVRENARGSAKND